MPAYVGSHVTWFLPKPWRWTDPDGREWHDGNAQANREGANESGAPYNAPGIALPNTYRTAGGWWRVEMPKMNIVAIVRQTDVGPLKPVIDLSAPLAYMIFTSRANFKDFTPWSAEFLGITLPDGLRPSITNTSTLIVVPIPETL